MSEQLPTSLLMFIASRAASNQIFEALHASGHEDVTIAQARLLMGVDPDGTRLSVLADRAQVAKQTATALVDRLESAGYVERVRDPADGRAKIVKFSRRGTGIGKIAFDALDEIEAELSRRLGAKGVAQVKDLLFRDWGPVLNAQPESGAETNGSRFARSK